MYVSRICSLTLSIVSNAQSLSLTLSHFIDLEVFLLYVASSQFIDLSFSAAFNMSLIEKLTYFIAGTKTISSPRLQTQLALRRDSINNETILFLSACCIESFNFTFWSCSSKMIQDHSVKTAGLLLSQRESISSESRPLHV